MRRLLRAIAILYTSLVTALLGYGQGTTGGLLYASDFNNWGLPQGNTPMRGTIFYPNPDICKVTANGYNFVAPKVGRALTIVDGANTETFTPTTVVVNNNVCSISGTMLHSHSSYTVKSATIGLQEAIDYESGAGSVVIVTPSWAAQGGTTSMITGASGNSNVSIVDQRSAIIQPYTWTGAAYALAPSSSGQIFGSGPPSSQVPVPSCTTYQSYVDVLNGQLWASQSGSPCTWVISSGISGTVAINQGGTNATTSTQALTNLGAFPVAGGNTTGPIGVGGGSSGCGTATGCISFNESSASGTPTAGVDYCKADSTAHQLLCSFNGGSEAAFGLPGGSNLQLQFNNSGVFGGATGISTDSATKSSLYDTLSISSNGPMLDIRHPSFAGGAVIDGVTDITAALTAAINQCPTTGGTTGYGISCKILLPCTAKGCVIANASNLPTLANGTNVNLVVQGQLLLGSTFVQQNGMTITGDSAGGGSQYQWGNTPAAMFAPQASGTVGTAISSTNTPVTITPTFTAGTIANLQVNSAITIAGTITCTATATRASNLTTLSFSSYCRIPGGTTANITGCVDSTYNGTGVKVRSADYPAQTAVYSNTGSNGSTTGCSVTGFNDDTFESVRVYCSNGVADAGYSCAAGQITVVPAKTHASTEIWGEVAFAPAGNTFNFHKMDSINVNHCIGACLFMEHVAVFSYTNDAFQCNTSMTCIPADIYSSFTGLFDSDVFAGQTNFGCGSGCSQASNPASFRCTLLVGSLNTSGDGTCGGLVFVSNSTIIGEIKTDANGLTTISGHPASLGLPIFNNIIAEQPAQYVVVEDTRNTTGQATDAILNNIFPQDNTALQAYVGCTDPPCGKSTAIINNFNGINTALSVNAYWGGFVKVDHADGQTWPYGRYAPVGIFDDKSIIRAETEGAGWNMAPSNIPYTTLNVQQTPSLWSTFGGATVNTGISAPDGSTNAGEVVQGAGNGLVFDSFSLSTAAGDVFLFGGWESPGVGETKVGNSFFGTGYRLSTSGTDTFQPTATSAVGAASWDLNMQNGPWHPVVAMAVVEAGQAGAHTIQLQLLGGAANGAGNRFFQPFLIQIPASANVPMSTIEMWRQSLLHGYVPSNLSIPSGQVLAINPSHKFFWGNDTDFYRGAQTATITQVGITSNVLTVVANNTYVNGQKVIFSGVGTNTFLNGQQVTITAAKPTQFTASFTHANVTLAADTGTVTGGSVTTDTVLTAASVVSTSADLSTGTGFLAIKDQGSCTMASGTCSAQSLGHTYGTAPTCFANWTGSGTFTGILKVPSTTTTVTPASSVGTDTAVVNWACLGK